MADVNDQLSNLSYRLESLSKRQDAFSQEIIELRQKIDFLKGQEISKDATTIKIIEELKDISIEEKKQLANAIFEKDDAPIAKVQPHTIKPKAAEPSKALIDLEKFIGENLINKIGIAITIIGVAIGAKYSIDNGLISPLTRIILGYCSGLALLGFGFKLKKNYESYSAVLVSGAIAIMYFITYAAYDLYSLIPQLAAFGLMVLFTVFTIITAVHYNRQVIALIGLVGAYAVPFLLSNGSGQVAVLFTYVTIINIGILFIAFKKYWKLLYYAAFSLTWLIMLAFVFAEYSLDKHFAITLIFNAVFFVLFYLMFIGYKVFKAEKFGPQDILLLISNSFIFYGIGYYLLDGHPIGTQLLGLFTVANALIHFAISFVFYKNDLVDRNVLLFAVGLTLVFVTVAVPVQLDGNWVTVLWAGEALLLFWIGRKKNIVSYENISYALMILASFSLAQDWHDIYTVYSYMEVIPQEIPLFNVTFLTSVLFIISFGLINYLNQTIAYTATQTFFKQRWINVMLSYVIPGILLGVTYWAFRMELEFYWDQRFSASAFEMKEKADNYVSTVWNYDLSNFKVIWVLNYSLLFFSILSVLNMKKFKNAKLSVLNMVLNVLTLLAFLFQGLYALSELRDTYLSQEFSEYYNRSAFNIGIRYVSYVFVVLILYSTYQYIKQNLVHTSRVNLRLSFDVLVYATVLWILSSELVTWMDVMNSTQSYKLGLSILWGVFALSVIVIGIWKGKKHLRIGAMALFAITLVKLFFYDIADLNTISKTIVLVSLGVLLLISSFLYNKYKNRIADNNEN